MSCPVCDASNGCGCQEADSLRHQLSELAELAANDTTAAELRQEIEFLKAEHAAQVAELAGALRDIQREVENRFDTPADEEPTGALACVYRYARAALAKVQP